MSAVPATPVADGAVVLHPPGAELPALLTTTRHQLAAMPFRVAGVPAEQVRREAREELAAWADLDPTTSWIATGHQSEMHHAGVWFKDAAVAALAEAVDGIALHLVADQDTIKKTEMAIPRPGPDGLLTADQVPFAAPSGQQCPAQLAPPDREASDRLAAAVRGVLPELGVFETWAAAADAVRRGDASLAEWTAAGRSAVNRQLGLAVRDVRMSRISRSRAFARFVVDLAIRHRGLFDLHRRALAAHRSAHGITNPAQPVPDLAADGDAVEIPLWAYRGASGREPVFARDVADGVELQTSAGPIARLDCDADAAVAAVLGLADRHIMLAPRALTLTMFVRSFLFDVFIHGTGGARYDLFGDALTRQWYNWQPPPFVTATATARMTFPRFDVTDDDKAAARWAIHHAWHNPDRYGGDTTVVAALVAAKRRLLERIAAAPPISRTRAEAFAEIHRINAEMRRRLPRAQSGPAEHLARIESRLAHNALADSREYFFAMLPRQKLAALIEKARAWAEPAGT